MDTAINYFRLHFLRGSVLSATVNNSLSFESLSLRSYKISLLELAHTSHSSVPFPLPFSSIYSKDTGSNVFSYCKHSPGKAQNLSWFSLSLSGQHYFSAPFPIRLFQVLDNHAFSTSSIITEEYTAKVANDLCVATFVAYFFHSYYSITL